MKKKAGRYSCGYRPHGVQGALIGFFCLGSCSFHSPIGTEAHNVYTRGVLNTRQVSVMCTAFLMRMVVFYGLYVPLESYEDVPMEVIDGNSV